MRAPNYLLIFFLVPFSLLIAACGSSGPGSSNSASTEQQHTQGQVVDPYIVGAVMQETGSNGRVLQRESTPSDGEGRFTFPKPLTSGSVVEMKPGSRGVHAGAPYQGLLRGPVSENGPVLVTPLTTLLANGLAPEEILALLVEAGLEGLTIDQLFLDPMTGLNGTAKGNEEESIRLLQAAMTVNALMSLRDNYQLSPGVAFSAENRALLHDLAELTKGLLNSDLISDLNSDLLSGTGHELMLGDLIQAVARTERRLIQKLHDDMSSLESSPPPGWVNAALLDGRDEVADTTRSLHMTRNGLEPEDGEAGQPTAINGETVYFSNCADCHRVGGFDTTGFAPDLSGKGGKVVGKIGSGHQGIELPDGDLEALAVFLDAESQPPLVSPPGEEPAPDGAALYASECAGCHGPLASTNKPGRTAGQIQAAIDGNVGGMGFISLTSQEVQAIADALPPEPPPVSSPGVEPTPDGAALYASECAGCHGPLASTNKPGRTAGQIQAAIDGNVGGMGFISLTSQEVQAIADVLPAASDTGSGGTGGGSPACGSCHGLPPTGSSFPDTAGAHHVHEELPEIGSDCNYCHRNNNHQSGWVDLGFPPSVDAKSGTASDLNDGTCGNIRCHGGKTTQEWWSGTIAVASQCSACHEYGTSQYNSYVSGRHKKHVQDKHYACTVCHSTGKLAAGHFVHLTTPEMEGPASGTIGGPGTSVSSYDSSTGNCTNSCHGSKRWTGSDDDEHDDD